VTRCCGTDGIFAIGLVSTFCFTIIYRKNSVLVMAVLRYGQSENVTFQVLTAVIMKMAVFWVVVPRGLG
jgi:hypothetical protein